jgi:putative endopeptidase
MAMAPALPKRFVDEAQQLQRLLRGTAELPPRWKQCLRATDAALGDYLGQRYASARFSPEAKRIALELAGSIRAAFADRLGVSWMSDATRARAQDKLQMMSLMIGTPERWRTYDHPIGSHHAANVMAAAAATLQRELDRIGRPVEREEWTISPVEVNAGYDPLTNQMVFPAGILQPVLFDPDAHVAVNLGGLGMIVGHELTHGFDDQGRRFDARGYLADWWAPEDSARFEQAAECVVAHYERFEPLPGLSIDGRLTLGENIADIGGIEAAFAALRSLRAGASTVDVADGFDEEQLFFLALGQAWCEQTREEEMREALLTDVHAPSRFRINGALANVPAFAEAFDCVPRAALNPEQRDRGRTIGGQIAARHGAAMNDAASRRRAPAAACAAARPSRRSRLPGRHPPSSTSTRRCRSDRTADR